MVSIALQFSFDFKLHLFFEMPKLHLKCENSGHKFGKIQFIVFVDTNWTFKTHVNMLVQPKLFKIKFLKAEITHPDNAVG